MQLQSLKPHAGIYGFKRPSVLVAHSVRPLTADRSVILRAAIVAPDRKFIALKIVHGTPEQRANHFLKQVDAVLDATFGQHYNITGISSTADLDNLTVVFQLSRATDWPGGRRNPQEGYTSSQVMDLCYKLVKREALKDLAVYGKATQQNKVDEMIKPQQPANDRHTKHADPAGLTVKMHGMQLEHALYIKEQATKVGGMLTNMLGMRQEGSNHPPSIVHGAVRVVINPPSFPSDGEESFLATVTVKAGQLTPDVSIVHDFSRMMRVAATAIAARDSISDPAADNAEEVQQHHAAQQKADQAAAAGAAAVSSVMQQPGLVAMRMADLAAIEIKGLTVAKPHSKEGTKYYVHTFSSAAAASLAAMGPLYVCDGSSVICVEPLRMNNPQEMKYAVLYRAPNAVLLSSDAMLLGLRDTMVALCRAAAETLTKQRKKLSEADATSYLAAIPTGLGKSGRMLLEQADADDMRLIVSTIKGTPIARLDDKVLQRLLLHGGLFAIRYADAQSQLVGAAMAAIPGHSIGLQQRVKAAISNLSHAGGSGLFWAPDDPQPDRALAPTAAIVEARGSKPSAMLVVRQLMTSLAADLPLADLLLKPVTDPIIVAGVKKARRTLVCVPTADQQLIVSAAAAASSPLQRLEDILGAETDSDDDADDGQALEALKQSYLADKADGADPAARSGAVREAIEQAGKGSGKRSLEGGPAGRDHGIDPMDTN